MTEKFRVYSAFRYRTAVDSKVCTVLARTVLMYNLWNDVFTGTAFSVDEYSKICGSDLDCYLYCPVKIRVVAYYLKLLFYCRNVHIISKLHLTVVQ